MREPGYPEPEEIDRQPIPSRGDQWSAASNGISAGEASSCGCAMCRPGSYQAQAALAAQAAWSSPQAPRAWTPDKSMPKTFPSQPPAEAIRAQIVARIQAELDALRVLTSKPEAHRNRLESQILLWLRELVQTMDLTA